MTLNPRNLIALAVGLTFGLGLCLSGMTEPAKVLGFLDLAGRWDPSLAFVMAGAIGVAFVPFRLAARRRRAWTGDPIDLPAKRPVDAPLIVGALVFGAGWGLAGVCPAPALVDVGFASPAALLFVAAMAIGALAGGFALTGAFAPRAAAQDA